MEGIDPIVEIRDVSFAYNGDAILEDVSLEIRRGNFIAMIGRQVDRLWAIVGDLLSLSRLEHDEQNGRIALEPGPLRDVLRRAAGTLRAKSVIRRS